MIVNITPKYAEFQSILDAFCGDRTIYAIRVEANVAVVTRFALRPPVTSVIFNLLPSFKSLSKYAHNFTENKHEIELLLEANENTLRMVEKLTWPRRHFWTWLCDAHKIQHVSKWQACCLLLSSYYLTKFSSCLPIARDQRVWTAVDPTIERSYKSDKAGVLFCVRYHVSGQ